MLTEAEPVKTELYHIPLNGRRMGKNMLIYQNNISSDSSQLMIVPFPLDSNDYEKVEIADISNFKELMFQIKDAFSKSKPTRNLELFSLSEPLMVHTVGNYRISVAPDLISLKDRVDWSQFTLPSDFDQRYGTFSDKSLYPWPCGYVIAEAISGSVEEDGFVLIYPDPGFIYFPTAHEQSAARDGQVQYSVDCYSVCSDSSVYSDNEAYVEDCFLGDFSTTRVIDGEKDPIHFDLKKYSVRRKKLNGWYVNQNLTI